jgi:hypothetical protein
MYVRVGRDTWWRYMAVVEGWTCFWKSVIFGEAKLIFGGVSLIVERVSFVFALHPRCAAMSSCVFESAKCDGVSKLRALYFCCWSCWCWCGHVVDVVVTARLCRFGSFRKTKMIMSMCLLRPYVPIKFTYLTNDAQFSVSVCFIPSSGHCWRAISEKYSALLGFYVRNWFKFFANSSHASW